MKNYFESLKKNRVFKFISSVKLAIPLMIIVALVVAVGTLYESFYNTEVAKIVVYQTTWFNSLLALLWINIFASTISRIPFKFHQIGFVITHIGLLTLLVGSLLTAVYGIDGQTRIREGEASQQVILPQLVVEIRDSEGKLLKQTELSRKLKSSDGKGLGLSDALANSALKIDRYLPFVDQASVDSGHGAMTQTAQASGPGIQLRLKSQFFDVTQNVGPAEPMLEMGPLQILYRAPNSSAVPKQREPQQVRPEQNKNSLPKFVIKDLKSNKILKEVNPIKVQVLRLEDGTQIEVSGVFEQGVVSDNKLQEGGEAGANPALEIKITKDSQKGREIVYAKYPDFTLNSAAKFNLKFEYLTGDTPVSKSENPHAAVAAGSHETKIDTHVETPKEGNVLEIFDSTDDKKIRIQLSKNGKKLLTKNVAFQDETTTPWMGMTVTLLGRHEGGGSATHSKSHSEAASSEEPRAVELLPKSPLPPSAIHVVSFDKDSGNGFWLLENTSRTVETSKGVFEVYYGQKVIELDFAIHLNKFVKVDYPGTQTPKSFESHASVMRNNEVIDKTVISMNEPLNYGGYVFYQAAYDINSGTPMTILSTNRDPGRSAKYFGSLILSLGIILFTLMRSSWYLKFKKGTV